MTGSACTLDRLPVGRQGRVCALGPESALGTRLQDLGLVEGTEVRCVLRSPSGSPGAYEIRGAVIALRQHDAAAVRLELEES